MTEQELLGDDNEMAHLHDALVEIFDVPFAVPVVAGAEGVPVDKLTAAYHALPQAIKDEAMRWGLSDTLVRDNICLLFKANPARQEQFRGILDLHMTPLERSIVLNPRERGELGGAIGEALTPVGVFITRDIPDEKLIAMYRLLPALIKEKAARHGFSDRGVYAAVNLYVGSEHYIDQFKAVLDRP